MATESVPTIRKKSDQIVAGAERPSRCATAQLFWFRQRGEFPPADCAYDGCQQKNGGQTSVTGNDKSGTAA
jgi:hypothetical protein